MKTVKKNLVSFLITLIVISSSISSISFAQEEKADSMKVLEQYSLFSEYYKNKDYVSALPFGWTVIDMAPGMFAKYLYYKMEDALWKIHDSTDVGEDVIKSVEDTILVFYDLAMKYDEEKKPYFQAHKAFVVETWFDSESDSVIKEYLYALELNPELDSYYYDRLGLIYLGRAEEDLAFKTKAMDVYQNLREREPENQLWNDRLLSLVEDESELVELYKSIWESDPENLAKAWEYASSAIRAEMYEEAVTPLEFLVEKAPETENYWNQLATAYQKTDQMDKSETAYLKLIELNPEKKDYYFNLGIVNKEKGRLSDARRYFQKASEVGGGWGLPIYYEAYLYEQSASSCSEAFDRKVVYQIALNTYRRALSIDPSTPNAQARINALSGAVPSQEDYFFRGLKSGSTVTPNCAGWIGKSVTVP